MAAILSRPQCVKRNMLFMQWCDEAKSLDSVMSLNVKLMQIIWNGLLSFLET